MKKHVDSNLDLFRQATEDAIAAVEDTDEFDVVTDLALPFGREIVLSIMMGLPKDHHMELILRSRVLAH